MIPLYDTHFHFLGNDVENFPLHTENAYEGEEKLRARIMANPIMPETLFPLWRKYGVSGGVGVQYNSAYKADNRFLIHVASQYPDTVSAVIALPPLEADTPALLTNAAREHDIAGVRFAGFPDDHGDYPWLDSARARRSWEVARAEGIVMELMYLPPAVAAPALLRIAAIAAEYPDVNVILDHLGWPTYANEAGFGLSNELLALVDCPNVYLKITTINLLALADANIPATEYLAHLVSHFGANRIMWGSDYGNTQTDFADMVRDARSAVLMLGHDEQYQVLYQTGVDLFARTSAP